MKLLTTIDDNGVVPKPSVYDARSYSLRRAARAIVCDGGAIALLSVGNHGYHKLPGGGIDEGEEITEALKRELKEELGCEADILGEVGQFDEYRHKWKIYQQSFCYLAVLTKHGEPDFTPEEIQAGFGVVWADSIDAAIAVLEHDQPQNYEGGFIQRRDLALLRAAAQLIPKLF